jgi:Phytanoyl-CoA dioxygenase (PhyH)
MAAVTRGSKDVAGAILGRAGRTNLGRRVLGWYEREGFIPMPAPNAQPVDVDDLREERDALLELWDRNFDRLAAPTFEDLTEHPPETRLPPLDRSDADLTACTADQRDWASQGFIVKRNFVSEDVLDRYWKVRSQLDRPHGWTCTAPYMHVPEVLALATYRPLNDLLDELIGEPMAVSLNLTGLVSTERNWHQDDYLNPPSVNSWYAAVWFALGDVEPDSGPFQFVPGSHRWPVLRRDRVRLYLPPADRTTPEWPRFTERFLDDLLDEEIGRRRAPIETFLGHKGDILIWHSRLLHRGSAPTTPGKLRPSFIAHYTGARHWPVPDSIAIAPGGGRYVVVDVPLDS